MLRGLDSAQIQVTVEDRFGPLAGIGENARRALERELGRLVRQAARNASKRWRAAQ
jgi:hypothetical protein